MIQRHSTVDGVTRIPGVNQYQGLGWASSPQCRIGHNLYLARYQMEERYEVQVHFTLSIYCMQAYKPAAPIQWKRRQK